MEPLRSPQTEVETIWRTILVTDARDSSKAYFSVRAVEALVRIERDRALFAQIAARHGGEETRDRGDGSMFAFCDPLEALRAAMAMQTEVAAYNASLPEDELRLRHRMGLHVGQIKLVRTRLAGEEAVRRKLSGDIVVTASRLEGICHPGEVCFSNEVHRLAKGAFDHNFLYLDATLKGFDRPMRCWSTQLDPSWERPLTAEEETARKRRAEERRLRERWEREQREKYVRFLALRGAAWFAAASLLVAGLSFFKTATDFDVRISRAWSALLTPSERIQTERLSPVYEAMTVAPRPRRVRPALVARAPRSAPRRARRPARSAVASALRRALDEGAFETLPATLADLGLPSTQYQKAVDDVQRVQRAQEWLSVRLEPAAADESQGVPLGRSVAGMTVLTRADERSVGGLDEADQPRRVPYSRLAPHDFATLLRAAGTDDDRAPEGPDQCARSLASLRRLIQ